MGPGPSGSRVGEALAALPNRLLPQRIVPRSRLRHHRNLAHQFAALRGSAGPPARMGTGVPRGTARRPPPAWGELHPNRKVRPKGWSNGPSGRRTPGISGARHEHPSACRGSHPDILFTTKDTKATKGYRTKRDAVRFQLMCPELLIGRFQQSRSELPVNLDRTADYPVRSLIKFHPSCPFVLFVLFVVKSVRFRSVANFGIGRGPTAC